MSTATNELNLAQSRALLAAKGLAKSKDDEGLPAPAHAVNAADAMFTRIVPQQSKDEAKLNKLERDYWGILRTSGKVWVGVQCLTFKLGDDCRYTPDFMSLDADGVLSAHETKGGLFRDDAKVKLKVAARTYPWVRFLLITRKGGIWEEKEISP